jgi:hypothetical protein
VVNREKGSSREKTSREGREMSKGKRNRRNMIPAPQTPKGLILKGPNWRSGFEEGFLSGVDQTSRLYDVYADLISALEFISGAALAGRGRTLQEAINGMDRPYSKLTGNLDELRSLARMRSPDLLEAVEMWIPIVQDYREGLDRLFGTPSQPSDNGETLLRAVEHHYGETTRGFSKLKSQFAPGKKGTDPVIRAAILAEVQRIKKAKGTTFQAAVQDLHDELDRRAAKNDLDPLTSPMYMALHGSDDPVEMVKKWK